MYEETMLGGGVIRVRVHRETIVATPCETRRSNADHGLSGKPCAS